MAIPNPQVISTVDTVSDQRLDIDGVVWQLSTNTNESVVLYGITSNAGTAYEIGYLKERPAALNFYGSNAAPAVSGETEVTTLGAIASTKFYVDYDRAFILFPDGHSSPVNVTYKGMGSIQKAKDINEAIRAGAFSTANYLGAYTTGAEPSVDRAGAALIDGALYYNTTNNVLMTYDLGGTTWNATTPSAADQANINIVGGNLLFKEDLGLITGAVTSSSGNTISDVAGNAANINLVAGQISPTNNIGAIGPIAANVATVAGISANVTTVAGLGSGGANVTTVAGISGNVTTVAGISSDVTAVAGDASDIGAVAAKATEIGRLGTVAAVSDLSDLGTTANVTNMATLGASGVVADIASVAGVSANVATVAGISSDVTAVAGDATDIGAVAAKATEIGRLGTADAVADMAILGSTTITDDMALLAIPAIIDDMALLAIPAVITDMDLLGAAGVIDDMDAIGATGVIDDLETVANNSANVTTVATAIANVNLTGGSIANVNTVAGAIADVNRYAAEYTIASSEPGSPSEGDLWYDSTSNSLKFHNGTAFAAIAAETFTSLVVDTTPQLGGDLDGQNNDLTNIAEISGTNLNIDFGSIA